MEDTIDSRTTGVGRKRALHEDATYDDSMALDSSEGEASSKRIKHTDYHSHSPGEEPSFIEPGIGANVESSAATSSVNSPLPNSAENGAQPSITWNQGVQSGLRTSFAKKKNTRQTASSLASGGPEVHGEVQAPTTLPADDERMEDVDESPTIPSQAIDASSGSTSVDEQASTGNASPASGEDEDNKAAPPLTDIASRSPKQTYAGILGILKEELNSRNMKMSKKKLSGIAKGLMGTPHANLRQAVLANLELALGPLDRTLSPKTLNTDSKPVRNVPGVVNGFQFSKTHKAKEIYQNNVASFDLIPICTTSGMGIDPDELTFGIFASLFIWNNLDNVRDFKFKAAMVSSAFSLYLDKCLQAPKDLKDRLRAISKDASIQALLKDMLAAVRSLKAPSNTFPLWGKILKITSSIEQASGSGLSNPLQHPSASGLNVPAVVPPRPIPATAHQQLQDQEARDLAEKVVSASENIQNHGDIASGAGKPSLLETPVAAISGTESLSNVEASTSTASSNSRQGPTGKEDESVAMEIDLTGVSSSAPRIPESSASVVPSDAEELALMERYFPVPWGQPQVHLCLACAESGHKAQDCPALICYKCNTKGHNTLSCPLNKRCGKCRGLGHSSEQCPEKLLISRAEAVPCDLCESTNHIEVACPMLWRSFNPQFRQLRKVREIPIHCFCCGGSGHYGPECGLYRGPALSGDRTWSKSNWKQFVDFNSKERAISAGVDYSIPAKKRHEFSIKGKANDPIDLDDSDDSEPHFIRAKVANPAQAKGQIRFGGYEDDRYLPREGISGHRSGPVPQYQNRPNLDSARYGREKTFSPPPRYGNNGNQNGGAFQQKKNQQNDYYSTGQSQPAPPRGTITHGRGGEPKGKAGVAKAVARAAAKRERQQQARDDPKTPGRSSRGNRRPRATKRERDARASTRGRGQ